jgi:hypothetical protein
MCDEAPTGGHYIGRRCVDTCSGRRRVVRTSQLGKCRRQDLNLHWVNPNKALNLKSVRWAFREFSGGYRRKLV